MLTMKILPIILLLLSFNLNAQSVDFNNVFEDKTLRVDYIFAGNETHQYIYVDELSSLPTWAGRRSRLCELPLAGNGQIKMTNLKNGECIYKTSFSSLFQEWIATDEAKTTSKSFENVFLLPYPKVPVEIEITLLSSSRQVSSKLIHQVDPNDILIRENRSGEIVPYTYIEQNGTPQECIDVVILAEGYTKDDMEQFYADAKKTAESIFYYEPFKSMKSKFNIIAVASPSLEKGVSIPGKDIWKQTAFGSHFDTFYSERYLTTSRIKAIHNTIKNIPYEHIIIIANTDNYGGGGIYNAYTLTAAHHKTFTPVLAHEFGHSFGGLGDEYYYDGDVMEGFYPLDIEPWEQNITTLVDFDSKWNDMLPNETFIHISSNDSLNKEIGIFEGGGYASKGVYRPSFDCRMRTNEYPEFCKVCQRSIKRLIDFYTQK